jgi:hypothetical protein
VVGLLELPGVDLDVVRLSSWRAIQIYETQKEQRLHDTTHTRRTRYATHNTQHTVVRTATRPTANEPERGTKECAYHEKSGEREGKDHPVEEGDDIGHLREE